MRLKRDEYYVVQKVDGHIAGGRYVYYEKIIDDDEPTNLCTTKKEAEMYCRKGEKVVIVRLVKV